MKIIDAHHHFWDLEHNYLPWLSDRPLEFRYGDYSAIRRNYLPRDYLADTADYELAGSVFVETEWDPNDPLGEVRWVGSIRAEAGLPSVMVAQAWLHHEDVGALIRRYADIDFVRGIRHKPAAAPSPAEMRPGAPQSMGDAAFRRGYQELARNGLSYDLQTPWWHLGEAADLAHAFPEVPLILNHTGLPSDRSPEGLKGWREAMQRLAVEPNTAVKISGLGLKGAQGAYWDRTANTEIVRETIAIFGVERCMFASNYPVDSLAAPLATIFGGFAAITSDLSAADRARLFHDNAKRIYRIQT